MTQVRNLKKRKDLAVNKDEDAGLKQVDKFRKTAREIGCDQSERRFEEALRAVARPSERGPKKETK